MNSKGSYFIGAFFMPDGFVLRPYCPALFLLIHWNNDRNPINRAYITRNREVDHYRQCTSSLDVTQWNLGNQCQKTSIPCYSIEATCWGTQNKISCLNLYNNSSILLGELLKKSTDGLCKKSEKPSIVDMFSWVILLNPIVQSGK